MELPSDLIDLLAEFDEAGVDFLLVGGQALAFHGHPRFTKDADLWLRDEPGNLQRALSALETFGAPRATIDALLPAHPLDVVWMGRAPMRIDLMKGVPGGDFERAWRGRATFQVGGVSIPVVGREELIHLKLASGRPQDLVDADVLQEGEE